MNRILKVFFMAGMLLLLSMACNILMAQSSGLQSRFNSFQEKGMQEKLYLHTDRGGYLAGEICWFKIYNVDAFFNRPLGVSKIAYVELINSSKNPVLQAKIPLSEGSGNGSLQLPVSLASGKYLLRAYTMWMKNFGEAYFFQKAITVINPARGFLQDTGMQQQQYDVQFFPEGGNMVSGLAGRVAFRVTDRNGRGVACRGAVVNEKSDTVARFETLKFGIGSFFLTPEQGHQYTACLQLPGAKTVKQALPAVAGNGYTMQLQHNRGSQLAITVQSNLPAALSETVWLFVHTRGAVKAVLQAALQQGKAVFQLDTSLPGYGISHFTVFNAAKQPVCERLYFRNPGQQLQIAAMPGQAVYGTRRKVTIQLHTTGDQELPVPADMSLAVYRTDSVLQQDDTDISAYCWLGSDLKGNIESPGYYLTEGSGVAADNLMLTHGWRRFTWQQVLQDPPPVFAFAPEYNGHIISGRVVANSTGAPVKEAEAYLSVVGKRSQVRGSYSNDTGLVKFEVNNFYGNNEIIVQSGVRDSSAIHIDIASPFFAGVQDSPLTLPALPAGVAASLFERNVAVQVQNAYSAGQLKNQRLPGIDTSAFYSGADKIYFLDDYVRFTTIEEILREYVPDVNVRKKDDKFHLPVFDGVRNEYFELDPLILLDGVPVLNVNRIMEYDPLKIRKLEVVTRLYYYGSMVFNGIVNFVTYNGDLPGYELEPSATVIEYESLQLQREFFSPVYETTDQLNSRRPDFRHLLYWSPAVTTSRQGEQTVSFFTSDLAGRYAATIQGITADGKTGSKTIFFDVKEDGSAVAGKQHL